MEGVAIVAITKGGTLIGKRLHGLLRGSSLYIPSKFRDSDGGIKWFDQPVSQLIGELFHSQEGLVLIISLGAVVRMIAKHVESKKSDPAVVVIDDRGQFVISVLSGHLGGANALARQIASLIGAQPVITTASDVQGTIAVDLLGRELGWTMEKEENVTRVSAAVVNEEKVGVYQDSGEKNWWPEGRPLPPNIHIYDELEELAKSSCKAALVITHRALKPEHDSLLSGRCVIYRPKSLVVGLGLHWKAEPSEIERLLLSTFQEYGLSTKSIRNLSTMERKAKVPGLIKFAEKYGLPVEYFTTEQLGTVKVPSPSEVVYEYTGVMGVAEAAAMLSSKNDKLVVPKQKLPPNVTLAVAEVNFSPRAQASTSE